MKNKNIKFVITGLLFFVATTSFAAFLDSYGTMEGSSKVAPPNFYLGSSLEETLLVVNKEPSSCENFEISEKYRTFKTKKLEGISFNYTPKVNFHLRAKGDASSPKLRLGFGYYKTSDDIVRYLAQATTTLSSSMEEISLDPITASEKPTDVQQFFYEFEEVCSDCSYQIERCDSNFYTRVELTE